MKTEENEHKQGVHKSMAFDVETREVDGDEYTLWFVGSSETVDRYNDVVKSDSWILDSYLKNPVFLWGHDHGSLPIGKAVEVKVNEMQKRLEFKIKFAVEEYDFARTVYKLYKNKFLSATSVGFIPHNVEYNEEKDVWELLDNELLELSAVTVPANPDALALGFRKGILGKSDYNSIKEYGMLKSVNKAVEEEIEHEVEDEETEEKETVEEEVKETTELTANEEPTEVKTEDDADTEKEELEDADTQEVEKNEDKVQDSTEVTDIDEISKAVNKQFGTVFEKLEALDDIHKKLDEITEKIETFMANGEEETVEEEEETKNQNIEPVEDDGNDEVEQEPEKKVLTIEDLNEMFANLNNK